MKHVLSRILAVGVFLASSSTFALGDREEKVLAAIGGIYLLNELIDTRATNKAPKPNHHHDQRFDRSRVHSGQNIYHYEVYNGDSRRYIQDADRYSDGSSGYAPKCGDAVSCAYQQGFQDGIRRRAPRAQYCSYYGGC